MTDIPDVLEVPNSKYDLLFENDKLRVLEMRLEPGEISPMHKHLGDHVVYIFNDTKFKFTYPNGKVDIIEFRAGSVLWIKAEPHEVENIGPTEGHNLIIETKK